MSDFSPPFISVVSVAAVSRDIATELIDSKEEGFDVFHGFS